MTYWSGLPCLPIGDFANPEIEHSSPALQADSLPSEPPEKPTNTGVGSLSLLQGIFLMQEWTGIQTGVSCDLGSLLTSWVTREALYVCKLCISLNLFTFTIFVQRATHSSILAWRIPWTEEPGRLQSMGSQESNTT